MEFEVTLALIIYYHSLISTTALFNKWLVFLYFRFLMFVIEQTDVSIQSNIGALIYMNELKQSNKVLLSIKNYQVVWISALIIAQKVFESLPKKTSEFQILQPTLDPSLFDQSEMLLLMMLDYNTSISPTLYTIYYFELLGVMNARTRVVQNHFNTSKPLTKREAQDIMSQKQYSFRVKRNNSASLVSGMAKDALAKEESSHLNLLPSVDGDAFLLPRVFPRLPNPAYAPARTASRTLEDLSPDVMHGRGGLFVIPSCP